MNRSRLKAFSLIELSIVILVIGILIAGAFQGIAITKKFRLASARALSQSSDVASIKNLIFWVDSTQENALVNTSNSKQVSNGENIKSWIDRNPQFATPLVFSTSTANTYPVYRENAINGLPSLQFNGDNGASSGYYLSTPDEPRIAQPNNFSIFAVFTALSGYVPDSRMGILAKLRTTSVGNEMYGINFDGINHTISGVAMGGSPVAAVTVNLGVGIAVPNNVMDNAPTIGTIVHDKSNTTLGFKAYVNGALIHSSIPAKSIFNSGTALNIGSGRATNLTTRFCKCYISEIIMYDRALTTDELKSVTKYLSQKWGIKVII